MKKIIIFSLIILFTLPSFARVNAYYPNGKRIEITFNTIAQLLDSLNIKESKSYIHKLGMVYFKKLTNTPLFVIFFDREYPSKISEMIASYNYQKYLNSYDFYYDLKHMIIDGTLTKGYLNEVFDQPDIEGDDEGDTYWIFKKFNTRILFKEGKAISANVIDYRSIERIGLAIASFEVTGSDISIGFNIEIGNYTKKTIKYIFISVIIENPVEDKLALKTVKAIGPIKPGNNGSYEFDDVLYSKVAKYLSIENIKIQFMDGLQKIIPKAEVQRIYVRDWEKIGQTPID